MALYVQKGDAWENCVAGYVADGAVCGGGKRKIRNRVFSPDVVDVSSGVEEEGTKSREKIIQFIRGEGR